MKTEFKFKLNDKTIELTEDEARELYAKMNEYFYIAPYVPYIRPIYSERQEFPYPIITCTDSTTDTNWMSLRPKTTCGQG